MKNIPIIILNKDRLFPLKLLVEFLQKRSFTNITIIDNESTYPPLLEWYKNSNTDIFYNDIPETKYDNGTFYRLTKELSHPKFVNLIEDYYIFTDSDVIPIDEIPENFVEIMINLCKKYNKHKIGLGLKIDDLPTNLESTKMFIDKESPYWTNKIIDGDLELYPHPIDTTFALYSPNSSPNWGNDCFRMGGKYTARHMPWYYDYSNLPEDEIYYLKNLPSNRGPYYSEILKNQI